MDAEIEIWVLIDEDGDYQIAKDASDVDGSELATGGAMRRIKIALTVPLPCPLELTATLPAEPVASGVLKIE